MFFVTGRVQGVGFRAATLCEVETRAHGKLQGFVRNLEDGRVEAVFQGDQDTVLALVAWCGHGPGGAQVERLEVREEPVAALATFQIERDS